MDCGSELVAHVPAERKHGIATRVLYRCVGGDVEGRDQADVILTEFELGLEMDSAEVRGVLFYEGQEWSRVVFDFLN